MRLGGIAITYRTGMIRILLLLDPSCDFQGRRAAEQLARSLGGGFAAHIQTIGPGGNYAHLFDALLRLRRAAREFDIIHALGLTALSAAAIGTRARLAITPPPSLRPVCVKWMGAILPYRDLHVIHATSTQRRMCIERAIPVDRCHLIRPGVDFARIQRRRNTDLRARLGYTDNDYVMLAAGESTRDADHRAAAWAASICHVLDPNYRMLLWGRGPQAQAVQRFGDALGQPRLVCLAEQTLRASMDFEQLFPAADCVIVSAAGPVATLPIAMAMASALPVVATVSPTVAELLEDRHTAAMTPADSPKALAQRIEDVRHDARLQWSISDMARTEAYEYFSLTRFLNQHRAAYRQIAEGEPVVIAEQAAGAGLRFHGRV